MKSSGHIVPERMIEAQNVLRSLVEKGEKIGRMPKPFHELLVVIEDNIGGFFYVAIPEDLRENVKERVVVVPDFDYREQKKEIKAKWR